MLESEARQPRPVALFTAEAMRNPYPVYAQGLQQGGLQPIAGRPGIWAAFRYSDCATLLRDPRLLARRPEFVLATFSDEQRAKLSELVRLLNGWILFLNEPLHPRLRKMLMKGFNASVVESWRPKVEAMVQGLLAGLEGESQIDIMRTIAYPLPVHVITMMLGLPAEFNDRFLAWSDAIAVCIGNPLRTFEQALSAQDAVIALTACFKELVVERRKHRGGDLISLLVNIEESGDVLTEDQLYAQCVALLFAGHETTRNLIGNGMYTLLKHPEQLAELRAQPEMLRIAIEELLRFESPVQAFGRTVTEDLTHGGVTMRRGDHCTFIVGAANRDSARFENPELLNLRRADNAHLAFGHGVHFCIGTQIARMEAQFAIGGLLQQFSRMTLVDSEPDWRPNLALRGLKSLHVDV